MPDLLRVLRAVRTFGGLVGLHRYGGFRFYALVLTCAGIGIAFGGIGPVGVFIALAVWLAVTVYRSHRTHGLIRR
jgi:hypothetical protein